MNCYFIMICRARKDICIMYTIFAASSAAQTLPFHFRKSWQLIVLMEYLADTNLFSQSPGGLVLRLTKQAVLVNIA